MGTPRWPAGYHLGAPVPRWCHRPECHSGPNRRKPAPDAPPRAGFRPTAAEVCMIVGCLALNASFEPLTMVPMRRALRLVLDGKAEIVEADGSRLVHSERLALPRPAVIRLVKFIHVPRRFRRQVT